MLLYKYIMRHLPYAAQLQEQMKESYERSTEIQIKVKYSTKNNLTRSPSNSLPEQTLHAEKLQAMQTQAFSQQPHTQQI
jgi:hypothetical protein